tara:strand:+ start:1734 stop:1856 length:123 start_codon:yes stop_codon:yes gene_type:complete
LLEIKKMPTTLIIKDGLEISRVEGYFDWLNPEVKKKIQDL